MTYFEWISYIEKLKTEPISDEKINFINDSQLDYDGNVKTRYLNHIVDVARYRINTAFDQFLLKFKTLVENKNALTLELNNLKTEIKFAKQLVSIKYFDEDTKAQLLESITALASDMTNTIKKYFPNLGDNEIVIILNNLDLNA